MAKNKEPEVTGEGNGRRFSEKTKKLAVKLKQKHGVVYAHNNTPGKPTVTSIYLWEKKLGVEVVNA